MDGIKAMQGEGPTAGETYNSKKILISTDPLALDAVAVNMIGMDIEDIPILNAAKERRLGEWDLRKIEIQGDYKVLPKLENFKFPKRFKSKKKQNYKSLVRIIQFLKTRPKININQCKN